MPGCSATKAPSSRGAKPIPVVLTASRSWPESSVRMRASDSSRAVNARNTSWQLSSSRRPASVRYRRLPTCSNSGTPIVSVSFLICTEAVGWAMCSSSAARAKLPSRAVASNR